MLVAGIVLLLYFWVFFADVESVSTALLVHDSAALAAGVAFVTSLISYLWAPRVMLGRTAFFIYGLLMLTTILLIANTGYLFSPFIALWMLVALFGPVFGWYGIALVGAVMTSFLTWIHFGDGLTIDQLTTSLFITVTPLIVGILIWQADKDQEDEEDRSYNELAQELRSVAGKSDIVIAAIADGVIAIDKKGIVQLINPAAQRLIGWGKNDAVGLDYKSVLKMHDSHDKLVEPTNDPIHQAIETNREISVDAFSLETAEANKKFLAHITVSPIGTLGSGVIVVFRDTTSERSEEREQAEFISTASHEMRTPVASIEGYLGLALNPGTAQIDEKAREYIQKAQESAQHLGRLFQDLLDVSRADDSRLTNDPKVVDLVPFMLDIVRGLAPKAQEKGLQVHYKPAPLLDANQADADEKGERTLQPVFYVNVDNDHLREVASNLIENAIKYTPEGSITIDITGDDKHVTFSVADSGIGIPQEDLSHLFQKFYRVDNSATREIGGTGLGLYLCRKLTEAMKGKIWAESEYQRGSTFFVQLPRIDHVEAKELIEQSVAEESTLPTISQVKASPTSSDQSEEATSIEVTATPEPVATPIAHPDSNQSPYARPSIEAMSPQPAPTRQAATETSVPAIQQTTPQAPIQPPMQPAAAAPQAQVQTPASAIPQPTPQPTTVPVQQTQQAPPPQTPPAPASQHARTAPVFRPGPQRVNTPLSAIEDNPRQYIQNQTNANQDMPRQF